MITEYELGYIVGLFEGRGSIFFGQYYTCNEFNKKKLIHKVQVRIANTNLELLEKIQDILKIGTISKLKKYDNHKNQSRFWVLSRRKDILWFLKLINKYSLAQKEKIKIVIPYLELRRKNFKKTHTREEQEYFLKFYKSNLKN